MMRTMSVLTLAVALSVSSVGAAPPARATAGAAAKGKGQFRKYPYVYETSANAALVFAFDRELPMDAALFDSAAAYLLETHFKANMSHATHHTKGNAIRYITTSGIYDVIPAKTNTGVVGVGIKPVP